MAAAKNPRAACSWLLALLIVAACSAPSVKPHPGELGAPSSSAEDVPDDLCAVIPAGCPGSSHDNGCPDVVFSAERACSPDDAMRRLIREATEDLAREPRLTRVAIRGDAKGAQCVHDALVVGGTAQARLAVHPGSGDVALEAEVWDGQACR